MTLSVITYEKMANDCYVGDTQHFIAFVLTADLDLQQLLSIDHGGKKASGDAIRKVGQFNVR